MADNIDKQKRDVLNELGRLSKVYSARARLSLIGLILVFFISVALFFFANVVATLISDASPESKLDEIIQDHEANLAIMSVDVVKLDNGIFELEAMGRRRKLDQVEEVTLNKLRRDRDELEENRKIVLSELLRVQNIRIDGLTKTPDSRTVQEIISVSITRIGAVMLSLFMMQILLGFYRYFTKLGNYYDSKVVAIKGISTSNQSALHDIANSLKPEEIRFGKEPQMPLEKIIEIVKFAK